MRHVVGGELGHAVGKETPGLTVTWCFLVNNFLDVLFAILEICDDFFEILEQQTLVVEQFLSTGELLVLSLNDVLITLLEDCHGVVVLLAKEENVEARLFVILSCK